MYKETALHPIWGDLVKCGMRGSEVVIKEEKMALTYCDWCGDYCECEKCDDPVVKKAWWEMDNPMQHHIHACSDEHERYWEHPHYWTEREDCEPELCTGCNYGKPDCKCNKEAQWALQEKFEAPIALVPIATGGSYLYFEPVLGDGSDEPIGFVPDGSSNGYYSECVCSGLTGDPNGRYCNGECHCGACDDHEPACKGCGKMTALDVDECRWCGTAIAHEEQ